MKFSPKQEKALAAVADWYTNSTDQIFRLFGYAGTGKTTIAKHLVEDIDSVMFAAYTGKAVHVLKSSGAQPAQTLHSLIYTPKDKSKKHLDGLREALAELEAEKAHTDPDGPEGPEIERIRREIAKEEKNLRRPMFTLKLESPLRDAGLLVVDECSMVDETMAQDLLSFGVKVLVLGDPAQLPPVASGGYFTDCRPDIMLDEIHRQAKDNPIVEMATRIRNGERLPYGDYGSSLVIHKSDLDPETAMGVDQVICGTNKTRRGVNRRSRELLGYEGVFPNPGERLICLKNNNENGLMNGAIYKALEVIQDDELIPITVQEDESEERIQTVAHPAPFRGESVPFWDAKSSDQFDFGYGITCHKAQGSQWNDVLVFDESFVFRNDSKRWLYTAVTRAANRVVIAR